MGPQCICQSVCSITRKFYFDYTVWTLYTCMRTIATVSAIKRLVSLQVWSPLRQTPQPGSSEGSYHSHRGSASPVASQDAVKASVGKVQQPEQTVHEPEDDEVFELPTWLSAAAGGAAAWQLPPGPDAAHGRFPQPTARSSLLSPGPLRYSYQEAAAASAARRAATRRTISCSEPSSSYPPLEASELSPERRPHARASTIEARSLDAAGVEAELGDGDGASPVSLRKRYGGFRACESLPASWRRADATVT